MFKPFRVLLIVACVCLGLTGLVAAAPLDQGTDGSSNQQLIDQLKQNTQNNVRIAYHAGTGVVNFIGTDVAHVIAQPGLLPASAGSEAVARGFLAQYGALFGLKDPASELGVMKQKTLPDGRTFVRFQQRYQGIPIIGAELIVQANAQQNIVSANGEMLPDVRLDPTPTLSAKTARQAAVAAVAQKYQRMVDQLSAAEPELWIYNPVIVGGPAQPKSVLVWRTEVTPLKLSPIREFVLIDARVGGVVLSFNQVDTVLNRKTFDANNLTSLPGTLRCNEANPTCIGGDTHEVAAHRYAGDTYNFYFTTHGRDSIDNAGLVLTSTVHFDVDYDNAFWDGHQMVYGDAVGFPLADDVVAHELTHGVTEHESNLIYIFEAGAINESLSDIWGEFVDQANGAGNDSPAVKWLAGEDITGLGAIRDMANPPAFEQPDKMSSFFYYRGADDNGGVHTNSGVNNKAAYLMAEGGTFNGRTVIGLGNTKVAKIYYEAQTNLLTSTASYFDLYSVLEQACSNLIGQAGISSDDCKSVHEATLAVQMRVDLSKTMNLFMPLVYFPCTPARESSNIVDAGAMCKGEKVAGQVSKLGDTDDVYKIPVAANQQLTISLTGTGGDVDLYLYPPTATNVNGEPSTAESAHEGNTEFIQRTIPVSGYWYVDVYAFNGTTSYTVIATISGPGGTTVETFDRSGTTIEHTRVK